MKHTSHDAISMFRTVSLFLLRWAIHREFVGSTKLALSVQKVVGPSQVPFELAGQKACPLRENRECLPERRLPMLQTRLSMGEKIDRNPAKVGSGWHAIRHCLAKGANRQERAAMGVLAKKGVGLGSRRRRVSKIAGVAAVAWVNGAELWG